MPWWSYRSPIHPPSSWSHCYGCRRRCRQPRAPVRRYVTKAAVVFGESACAHRSIETVRPLRADHSRVPPARDGVRRCQSNRRRKSLATHVHHLRAAPGKGAARREVVDRRRLAFDGNQPLWPLTHVREGLQQSVRIGMRRLCEQLARRGGFDDSSGVHHSNPIADPRHHAEIM